MLDLPALLFAGLFLSPLQGAGADPSLASYRAHLAAAEAAIRDQDAGTARTWLQGAPEEHRGWEHRLLSAATDESVALWRADDAAVYAVAWGPEGRRLACAGADGIVRIRDGRSGETLVRLGRSGERPRAIAWDHGGDRLACGLEDGTLVLWEVAAETELARCAPTVGPSTPNRTPHEIVWHPDGSQLAVGRPGRIDVHAGLDGTHLREIPGTRPWPLACAAYYDPEGARLVTAFWDGLVQVWDCASSELLEQRDPPPELDGFHAYHDLRFDPRGKRLLAAGFDGSVRIHTLADGKDVEGRAPGTRQTYVADFSPDGTRAACGSSDGAVRLWDAHSGQALRTWLGHVGPVYALDFSPDGERIATGAADGSVRLWDASGLRGAALVLDAGDAVWSAPFAPDGRSLATAASDGRVQLWDLETGHSLRVFEPFRKEVTSLAFASGGQRLVVASNESFLRVFDLPREASFTDLQGHTAGIPNVDVDPQGRTAASASYDGSVRVWDLVTGECRHVLALDAYDCAFSPGGARLATNDGAAVVLLDVDSGEELARFDDPLHTGGVRALAWSPDGRTVASGCGEGSLRLWDVETGEARLALQAHGAVIYGLDFHPDGSRFASASYDATVRFWSPAAPLELCTLRGLPDKAYFLAFAPEGERLAVSTIDGTVTILDTRRLREIHPTRR